MFATLHTSLGDIRVELLANHAPTTVENFVGLATGTKPWTDPRTGKPADGPLYSGVIFHRVIDGFMIQAGDPLGTGTGGPGYTFDDEIHPELTFAKPYVLAMANAGTRPDRITGRMSGTNGSQFFITVAATPWLNGKHTIFGRVADEASTQVVDAIATTRTGRGDRPVKDVVIESITVED
ncbi:MAG: peptidylprolyl isomerase [Micrococcales bacterium]|nr:peptidylprolyl isomerase [Micrococcales bacterium]